VRTVIQNTGTEAKKRHIRERSKPGVRERGSFGRSRWAGSHEVVSRANWRKKKIRRSRRGSDSREKLRGKGARPERQAKAKNEVSSELKGRAEGAMREEGG